MRLLKGRDSKSRVRLGNPASVNDMSEKSERYRTRTEPTPASIFISILFAAVSKSGDWW